MDGSEADRLEREMPVQMSECRVITVLRLDLMGYTALSESLDHEAVDTIILRLFGVFEELIRHCGGRMEKCEGDSILASFGVSPAHPDDAVRAVHAGWLILMYLKENRCRFPLPVRDLKVRVGIHTDEAICGCVPGQDIIWGKILSVVELLEKNAWPDSILVSEQVKASMGDVFQSGEPRSVSLSDGVTAMTAWPIVDRAGKTLPALVWKGKNTSDLVGRREELRRLTAIVERCRQIHPLEPTSSDAPSQFLVCIHGPFGIGKSRLIHEFIRQWIEQHGAGYNDKPADIPMVLLGSLPGYACRNGELMLSIVEDFLGSGSWTGSLAGHFENRMQIIAPFAADQSGFAAAVNLFRHWLRLYPDSAVKSARFHEIRQDIFSAFIQFISALSHAIFKKTGEPLIIGIDDFDRADVHSHAALEELLNHCRSPVPIVWIVTYDSSKNIDWGDFPENNRCHIALQCFSTEEEIRFINDLLGTRQLPEKLCSLVRWWGSGNPLYIQSLIPYFRALGVITGDGEQVIVHDEIEIRRVPLSLFGTVISIFDALPSHSRRLIQHASLLGMAWDQDMLEWLLARMNQPIPSASQISHLETTGIWKRIANESVRYEFQNPLVWTAIRSMVLQEYADRVANIIRERTKT